MQGMTKFVEAAKAYWAGWNKTAMTGKKKKEEQESGRAKDYYLPLDVAKSFKPRSMRGIKAIIFL